MLETNDYVLIGSKILGALSLLIFGMKIMSEALQKMAGPQLRHVLGAMTTNRWTGLLTGMFITVAVQSSSATTVMTVSFVNAGLLTLAQAISVIMGANIGTTLTAWILSLSGINSSGNVFLRLLEPKCFSLIFALIGILMVMVSKKQKRKDIGTMLLGFAILMQGMTMMSGQQL